MTGIVSTLSEALLSKVSVLQFDLGFNSFIHILGQLNFEQATILVRKETSGITKHA